ncbi:S1 RNA-binding domain-containing protein [Lacrimispora amygdalina]|uniref:S1 RNA-binding domain-containing protein n=1 Tax=Lacrimispora amygdalina TaxID=253257 RepID=A0A3E2N9D6_9FIRM|nr:S1 RNA-binding domain-containing protein [Clostridium indicum]RFZ77628.1 S1 RNA-binding domain-containing protein [Clostridium indicum]
MATRKNELFENEKQTTEIAEATDNGMILPEPYATTETNSGHADSADNADMDLNELLVSMDQELPSSDTPEGDILMAHSNSEMPEESGSTDYAENPGDATALQSDVHEDFAGEPAPADKTPVKPKRASRKKTANDTPTPEPDSSSNEDDVSDSVEESPVLNLDAPTATDIPAPEDIPTPVPDMAPAPATSQTSPRSSAPVLTIRNREDVTTDDEREDIIWHEIRNAYRTRRILTGKLGGIEQLDNRKTIAIVDYKGFRVIIPLKEMMIQLPHTGSEQEYNELMLRQNKILNNMLGADIDFIAKGIDSKTFSVVASRKEAMLRKRQLFYLDTDLSGSYRVYDGRVVQARVIAVAEKVIRVEVFGVETSIMARDLAWDWIGDAHERFSVGDEVLVRVQKVRRDSLEEISVHVDIKSISQNTSQDNLQKCRIQSKYVGKVTDVHKGVVYIRLTNGVNAIAHSCYDYRTPGKKDEVSFAVTRLDVEHGVAVGIITRIIRQNL